MSAERKPVAPYWHVWTDFEGVSHQQTPMRKLTGDSS